MIETVPHPSRLIPTRESMANVVGRLPFVEQAIWRILRGGSAVFMFHRILPKGERCYDPEMVTSTGAFESFLDWMGENYQPVSLAELVARREKSANLKRPLCALTFDDGWLDNYVHAFPLLRQRQFPATIFLPLRFIGTQKRFWQEQLWLCLERLDQERRREIILDAARHLPWFPTMAESWQSLDGLRRFLLTRPSEEAETFAGLVTESSGSSGVVRSRSFVNWDEVRKMQEMGVSFGSHTVNHTLLTQMEQTKAAAEIQQSREELMARLRAKVPGFAYPWGAAYGATRSAVKQAGYDFALTTRPGLVKENDDPWMLPRIAISNSVLQCGKQTFAAGKTQLWCAKNALMAAFHKPSQNGKRIKITFVIDTISEWEGGTERQLHALIRSLDRSHFEPELCFLLPSSELPHQTLPCTTRWISFEKPRLHVSIIARLLRLTRLLRQTRPHIVQTFFNEGIFLGILAARLSGVPHVIGSARNAGHWKKARHRVAFRTVAKLANHWQCNSRAVWDYVKSAEGVLPERIEILPNAIDLSRFAPVTREERLAMRRKLGLHESGPVFVTVAALTAVKDHATVLQAVKLLEAELPDAQYLVVGDGPLQNDLQQEAKQLGLDRVVHFAGRQADVRPYLAAADFGLLPSRSEGSSNSILEYMAMGLPSVVSDIPANRELVSGVLFTPGDITSLSEKLLKLTRDTALCDRLRLEYSRTAAEFSLDKFVMRSQAFYTRLAAQMN